MKGLMILILLAGLSGQKAQAQQQTGLPAEDNFTQAYPAPLYPLKKNKPGLSALATAPSQGQVLLYVDNSSVAKRYPATSSRSDVHLHTTLNAAPPVGPADYYQQHFGFFCKREWNWEKQTKMPVKLRLGTYQHAQRMEGKQ